MLAFCKQKGQFIYILRTRAFLLVREKRIEVSLVLLREERMTNDFRMEDARAALSNTFIG